MVVFNFGSARAVLLASVSAIIFPAMSFAQSFHTTPQAGSTTVQMFSGANKEGRSRVFSQGVYASASGINWLDGISPVPNNDASSLIVGNAATAWLCDESASTNIDGVTSLGVCHKFSGGADLNLNSVNFHNRASALVVTSGNNQRSAFGATSWNGNFTNSAKEFKAGGYQSNQLGGAGDNTISSLRVDPGFQVVACLDNPAAQDATECLLFTEGDYNTTTLASFGFNNSISSISVVRAATNPARIGDFGEVMDWPYAAIHQYLLTDGRVMFNDVRADDDGNPSSGEYAIWDPETNEIVTESTFAPGSNLFCAGFVHLPNGNLFGVATGGGGNTVDIAMEYHVDTGRWELAPVMNFARYYPSATITPEGNVLVTGGNDIDLWTKQGNQTPVPITIPEIYEDGAFRSLPGAEFDFTNLHGPTNDASYWPWVQAAPNGRMFVSGPDIQMRWLDTEGQGNLDNIAARPDGTVRTYGSYATFGTGLQVIAGGGNSVASSAVIDFNGNTPTVTTVGDLNIGRRQHDLTVMADGTVFANGGNDDGTVSWSGPGTIFMSEIFDPETMEWSVAADALKSRQYHSSSMLIPDGRVVVAGEWTKNKEENAELYSPPYLFNDDGSLAERPEINAVSDSWAYSEVVSVSYSNTDVVSAHLIKLGAVTHATNFEQRFVPLDVVSNANGTIEVAAPDGGNIAPPGHYMLFIMNSDGVPSVAEIVQVGGEGNDGGTDEGIVIGNDTSSGGNFIDGHHPSLYVNETDTFTQVGTFTVEDFRFYAQREGNPITPLLLRKNADNDYSVVAIGTTRTPAQYNTGENTFSFSDTGDVVLTLAAGDTLVTGFMDAYPDGSGWGAGTVIPANTQNNPDEIFDLLPQPLLDQVNGFSAAVTAPTAVLGERILSTNAAGLSSGDLRIRGTLERSYKFAVTLVEGGTPEQPETGDNLLVNGSFEQPAISGNWELVSAGQVPGWSASTGFIEMDVAPWPASDGTQSVDLHSNGPNTITQTVTGLTPGASYSLTFDYAANMSGKVAGARTMNVLVNGSVVTNIASSTSAPNYASEVLNFVAPANGSATISFAGTNQGGAGIVLDNISLQASDLPTGPIAGFVNGSFEQPVVSTHALFANIPGWDVVEGPVELDRSPWPAAEGAQSMDLNGVQGSQISQTLTGLTPGQNYTVSFSYGAHFQIDKNPGQSAQANVLVGGNLAQTLTAGVNDIPPAYKSGQVSFTAPASGQMVIGFAGLGTSGRGVVIDDVRLSTGGGTTTPTDPVVINGSFEAPDLSQTPQLDNKWDYVPSIPGWTTIQGEVEVMGHPDDGAAWPASDGDQSLDLGAAAAAGPNATIIEQTVSGLVPGVRYELSFDYGKHSRTGAPFVSANVYIDGANVGNFTADDRLVLDYTQGVVPFIATGNTVTIAFEHTTPDRAQGLTLDNVRIRVAN